MGKGYYGEDGGEVDFDVNYCVCCVVWICEVDLLFVIVVG